ncbi:hypothetical protein GQ457_04G030190 [Hibiscus cannabinus]
MWEVQAKSYYSWAWKKLLKLRESFTLIGSLDEEFKARKVWELLRHKETHVPWFHSIWGCPSITRHSFISWLMVLNRLSTMLSCSINGIGQEGAELGIKKFGN